MSIEAFKAAGQRQPPLRAPYNFVPVNKRVLPTPLGTDPDLGTPLEDGLSGEIEVEWRVETPLLVGGADNNMPFRLASGADGPGDDFAVSGSSLRGMIRAVLEIMAFPPRSCFRPALRSARLRCRSVAEHSESNWRPAEAHRQGWPTIHGQHPVCGVAPEGQRRLPAHLMRSGGGADLGYCARAWRFRNGLALHDPEPAPCFPRTSRVSRGDRSWHRQSVPCRPARHAGRRRARQERGRRWSDQQGQGSRLSCWTGTILAHRQGCL